MVELQLLPSTRKMPSSHGDTWQTSNIQAYRKGGRVLVNVIVILIVLAIAGCLLWYRFITPCGVAVTISQEIAERPADVFAAICNLNTWRHWNSWVQHEQSVMTRGSEIIDTTGAYVRWHSRRLGEGTVHNHRIQRQDVVEQEVQLQSPYAMSCLLKWRIAPLEEYRASVEVSIRAQLPWSIKWRRAHLAEAIQKHGEYSLDLLTNYLANRNESLTANSNLYRIEYLGTQYTEEMFYVYDSFEGAIEELARTVPQTLATIFTEIATKKGKITHYPFCLYQYYNPSINTVKCNIAIPVEKDFTLARYKLGTLGKMRVTQAKLTCSLENFPRCLSVARYHILQHCAIMSLQPNKKILGIDVLMSDLSKNTAKDTITTLLQVPY